MRSVSTKEQRIKRVTDAEELTLWDGSKMVRMGPNSVTVVHEERRTWSGHAFA